MRSRPSSWWTWRSSSCCSADCSFSPAGDTGCGSGGRRQPGREGFDALVSAAFDEVDLDVRVADEESDIPAKRRLHAEGYRETRVLRLQTTVAIGLFPEPFLAVATRAASELLDPTAYLAAVLGPETTP